MSKVTRRRSTRTRLMVPVLITAKTADGVRIDTSGETVDVSEEGARLRTLEPLPLGAKLRVAIVNPYRWRAARVVRVGPGDPTECGIELEHPGKFWGMYFPADQWSDEQPRLSWREAALLRRVEASRSRAPEPPRPSVDPNLVLVAGTEVAITALSVVRSSFQERSRVVGVDEGLFVLELHRVVDPGSRCRLAVKGHYFLGVINKVTARPVGGRWGVWVKV